MTPKKTAKIKILLCEPVPERGETPPHRAWWQTTVELVARPGITLDYVDLRKGYMGLSTYEEGVDYLYFGEDDLFMIITPDLKSKGEVESFLKRNWSEQPKVEVYPS